MAYPRSFYCTLISKPGMEGFFGLKEPKIVLLMLSYVYCDTHCF